MKEYDVAFSWFCRALNLNGCGNRLPDDKKDAYQRVLCDFYGTDEITEDILQTACNLYTR